MGVNHFRHFFLIFLCRFPGVAQSTAGFCNRPASRSSTLLSVFFNFFYAALAWPKARPAPPDSPLNRNNAVGIQRKERKETKTQSGHDEFQTGCPAACVHQTVTLKTASKGFQNLCAFAPLRLCVESFLHCSG
jgi:hypothetical protein